MNVLVQIAVPFAVGIPDQAKQELLSAIAAMGLGATDGPQGAGNIITMVAAPIAVDLPDSVIQQLEDALSSATTAERILGPANPIPAPAPTPTVPPTGDTTPVQPPNVGVTDVAGGPWVRNGVYWADENYEADLLRASEYIASTIGHPNVIHFLQAQSREEVGRGRLFTKQNNYWNMGAIDSNPQAAPTLATPEDGGQAWLNFLGWGNPHSTYANFMAAVANGESDVLTLATLIKQGGWATDPNYPAHVVANA